jgi:hypothetical protein
MRRLGPQPLTGAEKQRRHRERVKARLAEAERLKALLANGPSNVLQGLSSFYDNILGELGATADERDALKAELATIQSELRAVLEARAQNDLEWIREKERNASAPPQPGRHKTDGKSR